MKHTPLLMTLAGITLSSFGCGGGGGGNMPTCGAFSACGGDIRGTWTFEGVCAEGDITSAMMDTSGLPPECSDIIKSFSLDISGTLTYANGTETSDVTMSMSTRALYSAACLSAEAGMPVTATQPLCDTISSGVSSADGLTMTCTLASGGCDCNMTMSEHTQESDSYTVSGGTLIYSDGDTLEFCVFGNKLTFRSATDAGAPSMQFTLHRS
jgi:hypothetical protein